MEMKQVTTPLSERVIEQLKSGDKVLLSGDYIHGTGRGPQEVHRDISSQVVSCPLISEDR